MIVRKQERLSIRSSLDSLKFKYLSGPKGSQQGSRFRWAGRRAGILRLLLLLCSGNREVPRRKAVASNLSFDTGSMQCFGCGRDCGA